MHHSFVFVDESGLTDRHQQPVLSIGMFRVADTSKITQELYSKHFNLYSAHTQKRKEIFKSLENSRKKLNKQELTILLKSTTHHEFHFSEVDRFNLIHYQNLIDTVFKYPVYFSSIVVDKKKYITKSGEFDDSWQAYLEYSKVLISSNIGTLSNVTVIADFASKPGNSEPESTIENTLKSIRGVDNVLCAHSDSFILLQVVDLFLGATTFLMKQNLGFISGSKNEKAKLQLAKYIFSRLNSDYFRPVSKYRFDSDLLISRERLYFEIKIA